MTLTQGYGSMARILFMAPALIGLLAVACTEPSTGPGRGALRISIVTEGGDPDEDGYRVVIDSDRSLLLARNSRFVLDAVGAGSRDVSLEGVANNCTVEGTQPRRITVVPGDTVDVEFKVTCDATGIHVTTRTTGLDHPLGGFRLTAFGQTFVIPANGSLLLSRLAPGSYDLTLTLAENCTVSGSAAASVTVSHRAVTNVSFDATCARIDKRIAFLRATLVTPGNYYTSAIYAASAQGLAVVRLGDGWGPAWSTDGTKLAFSTTECDFYYSTGCKGGLVLMDPETRDVSVVHDAARGIDPAWSPDGKSIAFTRIPESSGFAATLELAATDGSPRVVLVPDISTAHPSWSPDGLRIVFGCAPAAPGTPSGGPWGFCMIGRDGTGFVRLTNAGAGWNPAWSPDGSRIAFVTNRYNPMRSDIALMSPDGTGITLLTSGYDPAWLPDGSRLVFAENDGLFTIGADGSNLTRLTTERDYAPSWRP